MDLTRRWARERDLRWWGAAIAALAICAWFAVAPHSASAVEIPTTISISPEQPSPGEPFTITAHPKSPVGTVKHAWDLDYDGVCETPWTTDPTITLTWPASARWINTCTTDDTNIFVRCAYAVLVGPPPLPTVEWPTIDEATFAEKGLTVRVTWPRPMKAIYQAHYTPAAANFFARRAILLNATTTPDGGSTLVHIPAPPAGSRQPAVPGGTFADLILLPTTGLDPVYSGLTTQPISFAFERQGASTSPVTGGGLSPIPAFSTPPATKGKTLDPGTTLAIGRRGRLVIARISSGAALGRVATLTYSYRVKGRLLRASKKVRLKTSSTVVSWTIPAAAWPSGSVRVALSASFVSNGVRYAAGTPTSARKPAKVARWRP